MASKFSNAEAYERYMGRWSHLLAAKFIEFAGLNDGESLLDVGCRTGSLAFTAAGLTRRSEIVGIDPVASFIEYARSRAKDPRLTFEIGTALNLPFLDGSVDNCFSLLAIQFLPDMARGIAEMQRVTRTGGTVAATAWDKDRMELHSLFWETAKELDPHAEAARQSHPFVGGQLKKLWFESGLRNVVEVGLEIPLEFASFDDFWQPFLGGQGPLSSYVVGLPPEQQTALRERLREKVLGSGPDRSFALSALAWAVRGIK